MLNLLNLYTTSHCHLCDEAKKLINDLPNHDTIQWVEIEIAENEELLRDYGLRIPVLERPDISQELWWPFNAADLKEFLA